MTRTDEQGTTPVPGGEVWWRRIGDGPGTPLLLLHGGPGMSSLGSADWLGDLPDQRPVVFYDQLGGGRSERPGDPALWTVERFVAELEAVRSGLGLSDVVLAGHSWGTMLATSYLATRPAGVRGVVLASPCLDAQQWARDQLEHLAALPADVRDTIERCERDGSTDSAEYDAAMRVFYARHLCRLDPWPDVVEELLAELNTDVYGRMWGSSEWHVTGTLRGFDARPVLPTIDVPVLFTAGEHDEARPATVRAQAALVPDAEVHVLPGASHLTYVEVPDEHRAAVAGFLDRRGL
jgi:proline iminopeptidase